MSDSIYAGENVIQFPVRRAVKRDARRQTQYDALIDQLQAAHSREKVWLPEKSDLLQRHVTLSQEFEHRLANSIMSRGAGFHADKASRQRLEELQHLAAPQLLTNDDLFSRVDAMDLEHVLGDIQTDRGNLHVDSSLM